MRIDHPTTQGGPVEWFTGKVWLDQIAAGESPSRLRAVRVHFTPGARPDGTTTDWLEHVTDAEYQQHGITREHIVTGSPPNRSR